MTAPVRIALLGCGAEYSGVMPEIYEAARQVEAEVFYPDVTLADVSRPEGGLASTSTRRT